MTAYALPIVTAIGLWFFSSLSVAAEPVKTIPVFVTPYYEAAKNAGDEPTVRVGTPYEDILASNNIVDIARARDEMSKNTGNTTPMTMMVLAIRLYDVGLRDDAVFWFYVAKGRYETMAGVLEMNSPMLTGVTEATRNFAILAGPYLNGYAFCDVKNQQLQREKALRWVEKNTYAALFMEQLPALPGDRNANLKKALLKSRQAFETEKKQFDEPAEIADLKRSRKLNDADQQFCWK
jgi:hypothetical protein